MATKQTRSFDGCWTCRLRRKKCDEVRPVCVACSGLELECLYTDTKPEWMDNGEKQKEKADWLKGEVKRLAAARRDRRHMHSLERDMDGLEVANSSDITADPAPASGPASGPVSGPAYGPASGFASGPASFSSFTHTGSDTLQDSGSESWVRDASASSSMVSSTPQSSLGPAMEASPSTSIGLEAPASSTSVGERELSYLVTYLDVTFPFIYPLYQPPMLDGGRAWLLVTLMRNKSLFHSALSLTGYIFSEVLKAEPDSQSECKLYNWDELQRQQDLAMRELQADMQDLNSRGVERYPLRASARVLGSMVQVLSFEVAIANMGSWQIHLHAATVLFQHIMSHHGTAEDASSPTCWYRILRDLGDGSFVPYSSPNRHRPWTADQASLRFYTASLLFYDVLAATALGRAPCLLPYHQHLLAPTQACCATHPSLPYRPHLDMADFFGVPNAVVLALGATASLAAWKKDQKAANSLSVTELVARAGAIEQDLQRLLPDLSAGLDSFPPPNPSTTINPPPSSSSPSSSSSPIFLTPPPTALDRALTPLIWTHAALAYLSLTVSGWQPSSPETRRSVGAVVGLLHRLSSPSSSAPAGLRTVTWPLAVAGSLALPGEEQGFRDLVAGLGSLRTFGTAREAFAVVEHVWAHRACLGLTADVCDLAAFLSSLGRPALLI